jgi:transposase
MPRPHNHPLRTLTTDEQNHLEHLARSHTHPAIVVARAKSLLAVSHGMNFTAAAGNAGRKSGPAVANLVARFNTESLDALHPRHGGGYAIKYTPEQRNRILEEVRRVPDRELDGTSTWSLTTLQRALRQYPEFQQISTFTILAVLHESGLSWQRNRTWCETGTAVRKRKHGSVVVTDPDCDAKKT